MNIRKFAECCSLSPATVSRYFNESADVSEENRKIIEKTIIETGYEHKSRKIKKISKTDLIITLLTDWQHNYNLDIVLEIERECKNLEKNMMVKKINLDSPLDCIKPIKMMRPAGVILLHEESDDLILNALVANDIPVVLCSGITRTQPASSVYINNVSAAYDGGKYLLELGHKNIAIISDKSDVVSSGFQRIMGCLKAYEDVGIKIGDDKIFSVGSGFDDGYVSMKIIINTLPEITAVFAFSDASAAGALAAIIDSGRKVPEDYSILGFDNSSISLNVRPQITTISQPKRQIAKMTVEELLNGDKPRGIQLPHELIKRGTCRSAKY